jgi:hypothetical protein
MGKRKTKKEMLIFFCVCVCNSISILICKSITRSNANDSIDVICAQYIYIAATLLLMLLLSGNLFRYFFLLRELVHFIV